MLVWGRVSRRLLIIDKSVDALLDPVFIVNVIPLVADGALRPGWALRFMGGWSG